MRPHSEQLAKVLLDSHSRRLIVDVFHGTERVLQDLPLEGWSLDGDLLAEIKEGGRGTVIYQSEAGESLKPKGTEGKLSPFRARLFLLMEISAGEFSETVQLGWATITEVPYARDHYGTVNGERVVIASVVDVVFESLDKDIQAWGFRTEQQPPSLASVYNEMRRITNMPVLQTVADRSIPGMLTYEASKGGRLKGLQALAEMLGGRAVVNPAGAITVVPFESGEVVGSLTTGPDGTITDAPYSVKTDGVFNCVVGNFEDENRNPIYSEAVQTVGPLSVSNGERTDWVTSETVKTQAAADSFTQARLQRNVSVQQYDVIIQCIMTPLFELGDLTRILGDDGEIIGQAVKYSISDSALMNMTIRAERAL